jgi:selenocysteine lyase/cysteine desulfurase
MGVRLEDVGTAASLDVPEGVGIPAIHAHDIGLANRLRAGLDMPPGDSAIVCVRSGGAAERLAAAGVRASTRAGAARLSFHLYNTSADVDRALNAISAQS